MTGDAVDKGVEVAQEGEVHLVEVQWEDVVDPWEAEEEVEAVCEEDHRMGGRIEEEEEVGKVFINKLVRVLLLSGIIAP